MDTKFLLQLILVNLIMTLNIINIIYNWKKTWTPAINAIILIFVLFQIIDFKQFSVNKRVLLLATISSCFMGPIMEIPVIDLFAAAIIPGILLASLYAGYTTI